MRSEDNAITPVHSLTAVRVERVMNMNFPRAVLAAIALTALAACGSAASSSTSAPAMPSGSAGTQAASLAPLTLGKFPSTTGGKLAEAICRRWQGLRSEYAAKLSTGTSAFAFNQWFSGPQWSEVQADAVKLGSDPAYNQIGTALGLVITGDAASAGNAAALDKACEAAD